MAFLLKNYNQQRTAGVTGNGQATIFQYIHVVRPTLLLPATTTQQLFRVYGGKVLVQSLIGTVTTILDAVDPILKVSSKALSAASVAIGTAVDVASTATLASTEVGGMVFVEGDGTAIVKSNAGAAFIGANTGSWVAPQGEIYITTGATNATGVVKWDIWYQPLDEGAYVAAVPTATAAI